MAHHRSIFDAFVLVIFLPAVVQVLTSNVICSSNSSQCAPGTTPSELSVLMQMRVQRSQDVEDFDDMDKEDLDEDFMEDTGELFIEDDTKGEDELRGDDECKRRCCRKESGSPFTQYKTCRKSVITREFKDCTKACTGHRRACRKQCKQTHPEVASKLKDCVKNLIKNAFGKKERKNFNAKLNACMYKVDGNCTDQCAVSVPP